MDEYNKKKKGKTCLGSPGTILKKLYFKKAAWWATPPPLVENVIHCFFGSFPTVEFQLIVPSHQLNPTYAIQMEITKMTYWKYNCTCLNYQMN